MHAASSDGWNCNDVVMRTSLFFYRPPPCPSLAATVSLAAMAAAQEPHISCLLCLQSVEDLRCAAVLPCALREDHPCLNSFHRECISDYWKACLGSRRPFRCCNCQQQYPSSGPTPYLDVLQRSQRETCDASEVGAWGTLKERLEREKKLHRETKKLLERSEAALESARREEREKVQAELSKHRRQLLVYEEQRIKCANVTEDNRRLTMQLIQGRHELEDAREEVSRLKRARVMSANT